MTTTDQTAPEYPRTDGDVIVLGPEIFASPDRKVISWQGENYVPQADIPELPEPQEELTLLIPLADKARAHLERRVQVHIVGGMTVTGRLMAVDDDCTITVVDGDDVYEIALQSIAVIETNRRR